MSISEATIDSMIKDLPLPSNLLKALRDDVIKAGVSKKEMEEIKDPEGWKHFIVGEQFGSVNKNWSKPVEKPLY